MNSWQYRYDTGWINRTDWDNVHLGSNTTLNANSNVTHNLNQPLCNLLVKLFISTDGTDANSFEMLNTSHEANTRGYIVSQVDANNILIQTGENGLLSLTTAGAAFPIDIENYYYKVKVWFLG